MTLQRDHSGKFYDDKQFNLDGARTIARTHATTNYCTYPGLMHFFYEHEKAVWNVYMETYISEFYKRGTYITG